MKTILQKAGRVALYALSAVFFIFSCYAVYSGDFAEGAAFAVLACLFVPAIGAAVLNFIFHERKKDYSVAKAIVSDRPATQTLLTYETKPAKAKAKPRAKAKPKAKTKRK